MRIERPGASSSTPRAPQAYVEGPGRPPGHDRRALAEGRRGARRSTSPASLRPVSGQDAISGREVGEEAGVRHRGGIRPVDHRCHHRRPEPARRRSPRPWRSGGRPLRRDGRRAAGPGRGWSSESARALARHTEQRGARSRGGRSGRISLLRSSPASRISVSPSAWLASTAITGSSSMQRTVSASAIDDSRGARRLAPRRRPRARPRRPGHARRPARRAPIASSTVRIPVRPGLRPTPGQRTRQPGREAASARKNAAELRSPGTRSPKGSSCPGWTVTTGPSDIDVHPAHAQHPLGVVAGRERLDDGGRSVR